jgi:glycerol uptake facilitator protein
VYATRAVSGAHLNPAVTAALTANGEFSVGEAPYYVAAQIAGATIAGAINYVVFSAGIAAEEAAASIVRGTAASTASFAGAFGMVPNAALIGPVGAFVAEVWMTGILLFMIAAIGDASTKSVPEAAAPVLVGTTVATLICTFGPVTGCGMSARHPLPPARAALDAARILTCVHPSPSWPPTDPARDLGPRLVTLCTGWGGAALTSCWIYTLGPVIGGTLGYYTYKNLFAPSKLTL